MFIYPQFRNEGIHLCRMLSPTRLPCHIFPPKRLINAIQETNWQWQFPESIDIWQRIQSNLPQWRIQPRFLQDDHGASEIQYFSILSSPIISVVHPENRILYLEFITIQEYLGKLEHICTSLAPLGQDVMLYLAAAVSDFYIPREHLSEHKIQSSDGPLNLKLQMVPKMLGPLTCNWIPRAFISSFKVRFGFGGRFWLVIR